MTDIVLLANKLLQKVEWQNVPKPVTRNDLTVFIADAIRDLYVMTGRALTFSESDFEYDKDEEMYISFAHDLPLDERKLVLLTAELAVMKKAQTDVNELTSYSTDAVTVSHGDKPFANLQETIDGLQVEWERVWYKMPRYHML